LQQFSGISIHDGWASYFLYDCQHAACIVHVLRELVFLAEEQGAVWAADLKELLLDMKQATDEAREQGKHGLDPLEVIDWEARFLELLTEGDRLHPHALAPPGTRGRCKQSPARNLLDRLRKHQQAVLLFLEDLRVDFDNNLAESDLRMVPRATKGLRVLPQRCGIASLCAHSRLCVHAAQTRHAAVVGEASPLFAVIPSFLRSSGPCRWYVRFAASATFIFRLSADYPRV
jgi:transposase IS66 family protein